MSTITQTIRWPNGTDGSARCTIARVRQGEARSSQIRAGQRQRQAGERRHAAELDMARGIEGPNSGHRRLKRTRQRPRRTNSGHGRMVDRAQEAINIAQEQIERLSRKPSRRLRRRGGTKDAVALKLAAKAGRAIAEYRAAWNEAADTLATPTPQPDHTYRGVGREEGRSRDHSTVVRECRLSPSQSRPRMRYLIGHRDRWRWTV